MPASLLTDQNFRKGFLMDDELMAGVAEDSDQPGRFAAFVLSHASGEYVSYQVFTDAASAIESLNSLSRSWRFESSGGCGEGDCSEGGCGKGPCQQSCQTTGLCELNS